MSSNNASSSPRECYVISLRPVGGHDAMRRAAAMQGWRVLALSPWRIEARRDAATRAALREALSADVVAFTSPSAVRASLALRILKQRRGQPWLAVGSATAQALRRAGVASAIAPARMDSEGLLALPALADVRGKRIGLVTAPGGRGAIASTLARRGAAILRADVYARVPVAPAPRAIAALRRIRGRPWLALSSGEALQRILAALPDDARDALLRARVAAASERLADLAQAAGFGEIRLATDARPRALLEAMQARPRR